MRIRNIVKGGVVLAGLAAFTSLSAPAFAAPLQSPDSDALVAGYQLIQFDLKECMAIAAKPGVSANGTGLISPDIRDIAGKMCDTARAEKPKLEALAASKNFDLPDDLPYYLNARYASLIRNQNGTMGHQYLDDQISSHEDALAVFQDAVATGTDPDVKAALTSVIPTVQSNLDQLKNLAGK
jgi:Domain of unknown function (DUF4142)